MFLSDVSRVKVTAILRAFLFFFISLHCVPGSGTKVKTMAGSSLCETPLCGLPLKFTRYQSRPLEEGTGRRFVGSQCLLHRYFLGPLNLSQNMGKWRHLLDTSRLHGQHPGRRNADRRLCSSVLGRSPWFSFVTY